MFRLMFLLTIFFVVWEFPVSCLPQVLAADAQKPASQKRFDGIELGPGITSIIQRRARIADWTTKEIKAYYEVLAHAGKTPHADQKTLSRKNLLAEIQRLRAEHQKVYVDRVKRYEELTDENPEDARKYSKLKATAGRRLKQQRKKNDEYQENPEEFPLFAYMTKSMIEDKPSRFHGKLVTLSGRIRKLISYPAHENSFGVTQLYEAWMFTDDSGISRSRNRKTDSDEKADKRRGKIPVVIIFTEKPEGMPEGEKILEAATVTGYVFRIHEYPTAGKRLQLAPMLLASKIEWHSTQKKELVAAWIIWTILLSLGAIFVVILWVARREKHVRDQRRQQSLNEPSPDFTE